MRERRRQSLRESGVRERERERETKLERERCMHGRTNETCKIITFLGGRGKVITI